MKQAILFFLQTFFCLLGWSQSLIPVKNVVKTDKDIITGAARLEAYLPMIQGKNVALVANPTSTIKNTHLVDTLLSLGISINRVFAPEHGFRGLADAGEHIADSVDKKTGIPLISLYGAHVKPTPSDLQGTDAVIFDIQDVGVRFYTYISTLHYVMEACAEQNKLLVVLDRPNPNGCYIDGPMRSPRYTSFVGLDPLPMVHGCTIGELATMINEEKWLKNGIQCSLKVIPVLNYSHNDLYELPVKPSPNLPNMAAVYLYPSLGLFEGTVVSVGRGTDHPFQVAGHPRYKGGNFSFTPRSIPGAAKNPPHKGMECRGFRMGEFGEIYLKNKKSLYLFWLLEFYNTYPQKRKFFNPFFDKLAGTQELRKQVVKGMSEDEIRKTWQPELTKYKTLRKKYLLYPDFD